MGLLLGVLHEPVCPYRGWRGPGLCSPSVHSFSSQECLQRVVTGRKKMKRVQHTCMCVCVADGNEQINVRWLRTLTM